MTVIGTHLRLSSGPYPRSSAPDFHPRIVRDESGLRYTISTKGHAASRGPSKIPTLFPRSDSDMMLSAARDMVPIPGDETAAWVSDIDVSTKFSVFLLTLVAYDASTYLSFQISRTTLTMTSVITFDKEVLHSLYVFEMSTSR